LKGTVGRLDLAVSAAGVSIVRSFVVAGIRVPFGFRRVCGVPDGTCARSGRQSFRGLDRRQQDLQGSKSQPVPPAPTTGTVVVNNDPHLRGPLALVFSPTGTLLTANGDPTRPSEIVEFTTTGMFIREFNIEATQGGAFGLATATTLGFPVVFSFAAVDDISNSVLVRTVPVP
jgi:hypothetical protein